MNKNGVNNAGGNRFKKKSVCLLLVLACGIGVYSQSIYGGTTGKEIVVQDNAKKQAEIMIQRSGQELGLSANSIISDMQGAGGAVMTKVVEFKDKFMVPVVKRISDTAESVKKSFDSALSEIERRYNKAIIQLEEHMKSLDGLYTDLKKNFDKKVESATSGIEGILDGVLERYKPLRENMVSVGKGVFEINTAALEANEARKNIDQQMKILQETKTLNAKEKQDVLDKIFESTNTIGEFVKLFNEKVLSNISNLIGDPERIENVQKALNSYSDMHDVIGYLVGQLEGKAPTPSSSTEDVELTPSSSTEDLELTPSSSTEGVEQASSKPTLPTTPPPSRPKRPAPTTPTPPTTPPPTLPSKRATPPAPLPTPSWFEAENEQLTPPVVEQEMIREPEKNIDELNKKLGMAAFNGDTQEVTDLIEQGADINFADPNASGKTALMRAADKGHTATVDSLLFKGAHVAAADNNGDTALTLAVQSNKGNPKFALVQALIEGGADVTTTNKKDMTALMLVAKQDNAFEANNLDIVKFLLERLSSLGSADALRVINVKNKNGESASDLAAGKENMKIKGAIEKAIETEQGWE